jgi:hypothetical protein
MRTVEGTRTLVSGRLCTAGVRRRWSRRGSPGGPGVSQPGVAPAVIFPTAGTGITTSIFVLTGEVGLPFMRLTATSAEGLSTALACRKG